MDKDDVELEVEFLFQTSMAIKISDGDVKPWIPKSQIVEPEMEEILNLEEGEVFELVIPQWLAKEKELI